MPLLTYVLPYYKDPMAWRSFWCILTLVSAHAHTLLWSAYFLHVGVWRLSCCSTRCAKACATKGREDQEGSRMAVQDW